MKRTFWKKALTFALSAALAVSVGSAAFAEEACTCTTKCTGAGNTSCTVCSVENANLVEVCGKVEPDADGVVHIANSAQLIYALHHQADNQTWELAPGEYDVGGACADINVDYHFPITANNLRIVGTGDGPQDVKITSSKGVADNFGHNNEGYKGIGGNANNQNFIDVYGENVSIENVTLTAQTNAYYFNTIDKILEAHNKNFSMENVVVTALSASVPTGGKGENISGRQNSGRIYFSSSDLGESALRNVKLEAGIKITSTSGALILENVIEDYMNNLYASNYFRDAAGASVGSNGEYPRNPGVEGNHNLTKMSGTGLTVIVDNKLDFVNQIRATNIPDGTVIKLADNVTQSINIPEGVTATLDLNGYNITNGSSQHTIVNHGKLTITGNGTVDNTVNQKAALYNEVGAEAVLNGGTYIRSQENGNGGNTFYAILNHGKMEINEGVSVIQDGNYSSLLENGWFTGAENTSKELSELTINGGTFVGGLNTIKNDDWGKLTIRGGKFQNVAQHAVLNWNIAEIHGGTFESAGNNNKVTIYTGGYDNEMDQGNLVINGGIFSAGNGASNIYAEDKSTVAVNGGTYSVDVQKYIKAADLFSVHTSENEWMVLPAGGLPITIDIASVSKIEGEKGPNPSVSTKDKVAYGDDINNYFVCTRDEGEAVGTYTIHAVENDLPKYYKVIGTNQGTLTIVHGTFTEIPYKAATTEAEGVLAHYECSRCKKLFWDKAATKEITNENDVVIAKLPADTEGVKDTVVVPEQPQFVENESASEAAKEVAKDLQVDEEAMAANGVAIAQVIQSNSENMEQAKTELKAALGSEYSETDTILLVVKPYLEVTPKSSELEGGIQKVELEITMKYDLQATIPGKTTVDLSKGNDMKKEQIKADTVVTVTLPESFTTSNGVIVRHDATANGYGIQYYISTVDSQNVTFKVPAEHGFSPFTLMSNSSVTVKLDGKNYTYTSRNVAEGTALPALSKNNYIFKGWKFEGIDGQHFNMTAELFEALLDKNTIVDAVSVFEGPLSEHPEIEEAKKNGTWGVDENKPAATAKPAAAAAVTPVRSSIPKTSDDSNLMLWVCLMGIAALGLGGAVYMKKRNHQ